MSVFSFRKQVKDVLERYIKTDIYITVIKALLIFFLSDDENNYISTYNSFIYSMNSDITLIFPEINYFKNTSLFDFLHEDVEICRLNNLYIDLLSMDKLVKNDNIFSIAYELTLSNGNKKSNGIFYTPHKIAKFIADKTLGSIDIVENPFVKILDPACGSGNFLSYLFDKLYSMYRESSCKLKEKYGSPWDSIQIKKHIIENNLFGADNDVNAVNITKLRLLLRSRKCGILYTNIITCDSLIKYEMEHSDIAGTNSWFWSQEFDYIIGNPPYQNMQKSTIEIKEYVHAYYNDIYNGQNDLYYYFICRSIDKLKNGGSLGFIIPVYFIEATYALKLRRFIKDNFYITYFKDLSSSKIFKNAEVHCCIFIGKKPSKIDYFYKNVYINSKKILLYGEDRWIFADIDSHKLISKLSLFAKLRDYAFVCKGMDTGLNECFLLDNDTAREFKIENELLKPVVRAGDIQRYIINKLSQKFLLYINTDTDIKKFPNALNYLYQFSDKLKLRWSYKNGFCAWNSLSTLRNKVNFEGSNDRIFVPYRSQSNMFSIDELGSIGLTDTTAIFPKSSVNIYYLLGILNSKLINFYNSICGKRKGAIYEFFPNPISEFPIEISKNSLFYQIVDSVQKIIEFKNNKYENYDYLSSLENLINCSIYQIYNISDSEIRTIEKY